MKEKTRKVGRQEKVKQESYNYCIYSYLLCEDDNEHDIPVQQQAQYCNHGERHPEGKRGHHRSQVPTADNASRRLIELAVPVT
jgi:hypothetical protein